MLTYLVVLPSSNAMLVCVYSRYQVLIKSVVLKQRNIPQVHDMMNYGSKNKDGDRILLTTSEVKNAFQDEGY